MTVFALQTRELELQIGSFPTIDLNLPLVLTSSPPISAISDTRTQILAGLLVLDTVGLALRWQTFGHAAHLGGAAFGFLHYLWGHESFSRTSRHIRGNKDTVDE